MKFIADDSTILLKFSKKKIANKEFAVKLPTYIDNNVYTNPSGMMLQVLDFKVSPNELSIETSIELEATLRMVINESTSQPLEIDWPPTREKLGTDKLTMAFLLREISK